MTMSATPNAPPCRRSVLFVPEAVPMNCGATEVITEPPMLRSWRRRVATVINPTAASLPCVCDREGIPFARPKTVRRVYGPLHGAAQKRLVGYDGSA
jgi:hypothetical protein